MTSLVFPVANSLWPAAGLLAEEAPDQMGIVLGQLLAVAIFAVVGIVILALCFWIMGKLTSFSLVKEIEEDQNVALGIVLGCIAIGVSLIIAAAIIG